MRGLAAVFRKELAITFSSVIFYAVAFIFLIVSGYFFYSNTALFHMVSLQAAQGPLVSQKLNLTDMVVKPFLSDLSVLMLLILPLITMRVYAEEKKSGTIELLFTYPVSDAAVLAGKYLAALLVFLVLLAGTLPCLIILGLFGNPDWGVVISGYLGLALTGGSFIALGVFTSSVTENQIVAAVISFGTLLLFWVIGWTGMITGPPLGPVLTHISFTSHIDAFAQGLIDTRDVVFYLLFIFFWLFLTHRFLNSRFWRG